jgi:thiol-disulfide isomerase/thioredoxin
MEASASPKTSRDSRAAALVIGSCAAVLLVTAALGFVPAIGARLGWSGPEPLAYSVGATVDVSPQIYSESQQTLIAFASGTCGACRRSASTFTALAADLSGTETRFVLLTPNTRHVDQQALVEAIGLTSAETMALDLSKLRLKNVPAVVLVDRAGHVLFSREGLVDEDARTSIRQAIVAHQS